MLSLNSNIQYAFAPVPIIQAYYKHTIQVTWISLHDIEMEHVLSELNVFLIFYHKLFFDGTIMTNGYFSKFCNIEICEIMWVLLPQNNIVMQPPTIAENISLFLFFLFLSISEVNKVI